MTRAFYFLFGSDPDPFFLLSVTFAWLAVVSFGLLLWLAFFLPDPDEQYA